jgi:multimeric flavodoxin WrbA
MASEEKKKVVVLSCGRPMGNSEILGREACFGAEEAGAKTEILRLYDFTIKPCTGCEACSMTMAKGGVAKCVVKGDDVDFLAEKVCYEDCALIISAPVYFLSPPGYLKMLIDRFLPFIMNRPGAFFDKTRVGASIAVGGGEPAWTPQGLFATNMFILYNRVLVDQMMVNFASRPGLVTLNEKALRRARELGRNVATAANTPIEKVRFMGEELENACPVCHVNIWQIGSNVPKGGTPESGFFDLEMLDGVMRKSPDASQVVCPNCDIIGKLEIVGGKFKVSWDEADVRHHRVSKGGMPEHFELIKRIHMKAFEQGEKISAMKEVYRSQDNLVKPPRAKSTA